MSNSLGLGNRIEPLHWPDYYLQRTWWENVLRDFPFVGLNAKSRRDINNQLKYRTVATSEQEWANYPREYQLSRLISPIISKWIRWESDLFIPLDPCCILFCDNSVDMRSEMAMMEIANASNSTMEVFSGIDLLDYVSLLKNFLCELDKTV